MIAKRKTIYRNLPKKDFEKVKKELETLRKAKNNLMLKFPLNNMNKFINERGTECKKNCYVFLKSGGADTIIEILKKFNHNESTMEVSLRILRGCLWNIPDTESAVDLSVPSLVTLILQADEKIKKKVVSDLIIEFLLGVSQFPDTHLCLNDAKIIDFLKTKIVAFKDEGLENFKVDQLKVLGQVFSMVSNFAQNREVQDQMNGFLELVSQLLAIYKRNLDTSFVRDLALKILVNLSFHPEGRAIVKDSGLDTRAMANSVFEARNLDLDLQMGVFLGNFVSTEVVEESLQKIDISSGQLEDIILEVIFLSYVAKNEKFFEVFESQKQTTEHLVNILGKKDLREKGKAGTVSLLQGLITQNKGLLSQFIDLRVPSKVFVACRGLGYLSLAKCYGLLNACLRVESTKVLGQLKEVKAIDQAITEFYALKTRFQKYKEKSLDFQRALDSIEFQKSETTRIILESLKQFKRNKIVSMDLALEFLGCKDFLVSICGFFTLAFDHLSTYRKCEAEFMDTALMAIKIYKGSKHIHESVFQTLSKMDFSPAVSKPVLTGKLPFTLCEVLWRKNHWKLFALYLLRFWGKLVADKESLKFSQTSKHCIRLVASITHFVNDKEYELIEAGGSDILEGGLEQKPEKKELNFQQEREITVTGTNLLQKMIDTTMLDTFKSMIDSQIQKFRPSFEAIQILRADYAVLAVLNGIPFFGNLGIQEKMQNKLYENISRLPRKDYDDKGKLMSDCVRAIANYIKITFDEKSVRIYTQGKVSVLVFDSLTSMLKNFKKPEDSWLVLRAFREWLLNRIKIIEEAEDSMRYRIYDPDSFLMTPEKDRTRLVTDALDSLYQTFQNFPKEEKVVALVFEVIVLLGYLYPRWRDRVAKEFIPLALETLSENDFSEETDQIVLKALKFLTGTDDQSEDIVVENIESMSANGGIEAIAEAIARHDFKKEFIKEARPLLEGLQNSPDSQEGVNKDVEKLMEVIKEFDQLSEKEKRDPVKANELEDAVQKLNVLCLVPGLREVCMENGYNGHLKRLLDYSLNIARDDGLDGVWSRSLKRLVAQGFGQTLDETVGAENDKKKVKDALDALADDGVESLLRTLQEEKNNPEIVGFVAPLVNKFFPGKNSQKVKDAAQKLNFQPDLEFILKEYGKSKDPNLCAETTNLFLNLSTKIDSEMTEKILKRLIRDINTSLEENDSEKLINALKNLRPFANAEIWNENNPDFDLMDILRKAMRRVHSNSTMKLEQEAFDICKDSLKTKGVPGLTSQNKERLREEVETCVEVVEILKGMDENMMNKFTKSEDLVRLFPLVSFFDPSKRVLDVYGELLKGRSAGKVLSEEGAFEVLTFALMKNNKDCFRAEEFEMGQNLSASSMNMSGINLRTSKISNLSHLPKAEIEKIIQQKNEQIKENIRDYGKVVEPLLGKTKELALIDQYIHDVGNLSHSAESTRIQLLATSRLLAAALKVGVNGDTIKLRLNKLQKAFGEFLDKNEKKYKMDASLMHSMDVVDKKSWNFFSRIMRKTFKGVGLNVKQLQNKDLWNKLVNQYFFYSPQLLSKNKRKVLKNVKSCVPVDEMPSCVEKVIFNEHWAQIELDVEQSSTGLCRNSLISQADQILRNLLSQLEEDADELNLFVFEIIKNMALSSKVLNKWREKSLGGRLLSNLEGEMETPEQKQIFMLASQVFRLVLYGESENQTQLISEIADKNLLDKFVTLFKTQVAEDLGEYEHSVLLDSIALTLRSLFQISKNRFVLIEQELPKTLTELLHKSQICDAVVQRFQPGATGFEQFKTLKHCIILFMLTWNDRTLGNKYNTEEKGLMSQLLRLVDTRLKSIQNPRKFPFKVKSDVHEDIEKGTNGNIFVSEAILYALGEFSETSDGRDKLMKLTESDETPLFKRMYVAFSKYDQLPLVATKCLQIARNILVNLNQSELEEVSKEVKEISGDVKIKLAKFSGHKFKKIPQYLKDMQIREDRVEEIKVLRDQQKMKALEMFGEALKLKLERDKIVDRETLESAFEISKIIGKTKEKLFEIEAAPEMDEVPEGHPTELSKPDKKNFEMALDVLIEKLQNNDGEVFEFKNMDTDKHLREIANCPQASLISRIESLQALNLMCEEVEVKKAMSRNDFFTNKSVEQISHILEQCEEGRIKKLDSNISDLFLQDLTFLKHMTDYHQGAMHCLEEDNLRDGQLVKGLLEVITSEERDNARHHKKEALNVLLNLFKHSKSKELELLLMENIDIMLDNNKDLLEIESPAILIVGLLSSASASKIQEAGAPEMEVLEESVIVPGGGPEWEEKNQESLDAVKEELVVNKDILPKLKNVLMNHPDSEPCLNNMAVAVFSLVNNSPQYNSNILGCDILPTIAKQFAKKVTPDFHCLYDNMLDTLLQLSYQNEADKTSLIGMGFSKGLVALLIHYSGEDHYDPEMCLQILKVMANFSLVEQGSQELLKDGVIPAFQTFFDNYKDRLDSHFEIMLSVMSNLTYERNPKVIKTIEKQNGLKLILDCIAFYVEQKNALCLEICLDCLTHMSSSPNTCEDLESTPIMDLLVDILRQKLNGDLIYKDLRCLIIFADYENLAKRFIDKNGPAVSLDILRAFADDPKNVYSILRLNREITKKYPKELDSIVEAGIPEKVIRSYQREWQLEIITLMMELFQCCAEKENVKVVISEMFLVELMHIMDEYFPKRKIVKSGISCLSVVSDNVTSVNNLFYLDGNELSDKILKKYMSYSKIVLATLYFMENMIRLKDYDESKQKLLKMETDKLVEKIVDTTDPDTQPKLNKQARVVLELLRNEKKEIMEIEDLEKSELEQLEKKPKVLNTYRETRPEFLHNQIPIDVQRFLKQGKILTLYGEDKVKRTMHFFLSSDLTDLKCKKPKEDNVKPKWIIPLHKIKKIKYGYNKTSPIAKSGGFFRKAPSNDRCFAVYGPETLDGPKNFHFECGSAERARQWFSYLTMVHNEYLSNKASKLKAEKNSEDEED